MIKLAGSKYYFLNARFLHSIASVATSYRCLCLFVLMFFLAVSVSAQNTKGDTPASSRENRFRTGPRKENKKVKQSRRVSSSRDGSRARGRARGGEKAGKPIKPVFNVNKPRERERAWKGDLTGRPLRKKNSSSKKIYVHQQKGPFVKRNPPDRQGRQNVTRGKPTRVRSVTGSVRNVYPQRGPYVNNRSSRPRDSQRPVSNRQVLARLKKLQSDGKRRPGDDRKTRVVPRSVSRPFIRHKSINIWANFPRPKRKGEQAQTTDIAGRKIRGRNFETPRRSIIPAPNTYRGRREIRRDKPYGGPVGGYRSATRGSSAWQGDIAGRKIRHRDRSSKKRIEGIPFLSKKPRSATRNGRVGAGLPGMRPGVNISGIPVKSRMGRRFADQGEGYTGGIRRGRPMKGGGSVSGRLWNNNGRAIATRTPKAGIPGFPVKRRLPREFQDQGEEFTGVIKARRPKKGGGSVSGVLWNNNEKPIAGRQPEGGERAANYTGNIKVKSRGPSAAARKAAAFRGNEKLMSMQPAFSDQGEEFTGHQRLSRFRRNYIQNKLANENSIKKKRPDKTTYAVNGLHIKVKRRSYVENKNAADEALKKLKPTETDRSVAGLQVRVKQYRYVRNPSSSSEALKVREPGRAFARVTDYQGNIKMQKHRLISRNRGLHPDAQFVRTNRNNVQDERDAVTNFKLWWARLFKKQDTQPDHLKEKGKKPRYDKGELGMWYD